VESTARRPPPPLVTLAPLATLAGCTGASPTMFAGQVVVAVVVPTVAVLPIVLPIVVAFAVTAVTVAVLVIVRARLNSSTRYSRAGATAAPPSAGEAARAGNSRVALRDRAVLPRRLRRVERRDAPRRQPPPVQIRQRDAQSPRPPSPHSGIGAIPSRYTGPAPKGKPGSTTPASATKQSCYRP